MALEPADGRLRLERAERVQRVTELAGQDDVLVANEVAGVDRYVVLGRAGERLEPVHVIRHGDGRAGRIAGGLVHVPGCPGGLAPRHDAIVGVQDDVVAVVLEATERRRLGRVRVAHEPQGVVRVGGQDDGVEPFSRSACGPDRCPRLVPRHRGDRIAGPHGPGGERGDEPVHIRARSPAHGPPRQRPADPDEPVVVEEAQQVVDRVLERATRSRGPDGRRDRDEEVVAEGGPEVAVVEVLAKGQARRRRPVEDRSGVAIETGDVGEHP